jgi:predicted transglutaminase-like cysteine proteinase
MRLVFNGLVMGLLLTSVAAAQELGASAKLEVIVSPSGEAAAPWVFRQLCQKSTGRCAMALMNPGTGEVARMGGMLGTDFELTGNGQEIRRAETAMDRAIRLKAAPS